VPVATVAVNGAANAGLLAVRILATSDETLTTRLAAHRAELAAQAHDQDRKLPR
jgi:5-(carboxyamino)imidazole ribonucleotide mutase